MKEPWLHNARPLCYGGELYFRGLVEDAFYAFFAGLGFGREVA